MNDNLRYEIKMVFGTLRLDEVRSWVFAHPDAFQIAYPTRQVSNIYFDTFDRNLMQDHINGVATRAKFRFRWYGESWDIKRGQIEIKVKKGRLGYKKTQPIFANISLSKLSWHEIMHILNENISEEFPSIQGDLIPVVINQYRREYYESMDGQIRVTLDYNMRAFAQSFGFSPNISFEQPLQNNVIIEMKATKNNHKRIADSLAEFPLYCTQNSKYLNGMEYAI